MAKLEESLKYKKIKRKDGTTVDEHRVVAQVENAGRDTVVHHVNGNGMNNAKENLLIMSKSEHAIAHGFGATINGNKTFVPDADGNGVCSTCGTRKPFDAFCKDREAVHGRRSKCKECFNRARRERRKQFR